MKRIFLVLYLLICMFSFGNNFESYKKVDIQNINNKYSLFSKEFELKVSEDFLVIFDNTKMLSIIDIDNKTVGESLELFLDEQNFFKNDPYLEFSELKGNIFFAKKEVRKDVFLYGYIVYDLKNNSIYSFLSEDKLEIPKFKEIYDEIIKNK